MSGKYKAYLEYKDSGVEWLGKIPKDWKRKRAGHHIDFITGFAFKSEFFSFESGIKLVRGDNVTEGKLRWGDKTRYWQKVTKDLEQYLLRDKDILIGMDGSKVGKNYTVVFESDLPLLLVQRVARLRVDDKLDYRFLAYLIGSELFRTWTTLVKTDPAIPHISPADIKGFPIPFPSYIEQETIANFLDHETAKIDTLIEKQQQLIQLLKEKRQAVISHAVTKGLNPDAPMKDSGVEWLGEVPEHWNRVPLKLLIRTRKGVAFKSNDFCDQGIRVVKASDIKEHSIRTSDVFLSKEFVEEYPKAILSSGDIILSTVGSNPDVINSAVGQIGMVPKELNGTLLNQNTVIYDPDENKIIREYLFYVLQMRGYRDHLDLHAHGTANQSSLSISDMLNFMISLPPLAEQIEICDYLNTQQETLKCLELRSQKSGILLKERRTALISAAVTGKIDVRDWQALAQTDSQTEAVGE